MRMAAGLEKRTALTAFLILQAIPVIFVFCATLNNGVALPPYAKLSLGGPDQAVDTECAMRLVIVGYADDFSVL